MTATSVNEIISLLTDITRLEAGEFASRLGAPLEQTDENPYWVFYDFKPAEPFATGELRLGKPADRALLVLSLPEDSELKRADLDLSPWGQPRGLDPNPRIPPEGADAYLYEVNGVQVSFQFTHTSRRLRLVALEWKGKAET